MMRLLCLLLALAGASARADCLEPSAGDTAPALAREYLSHYEAYRRDHDADEADLARLCAARTAERLFALEPGAYEGALRALEGEAGRDPVAYFDLAYSLELAWEQRYLRSYYKHYLDEAARRRGTAALLAGLTGGVLLGPAALRGELSLWRAFYAGTGAALSGAAGQYAVDRFTAPAIPAAPAALLAIATPAELERVEEADRAALTNSLVAGAAGGAASYVAARSVARTLLAAPNIWAKAGGLALTVTLGWFTFESVGGAAEGVLRRGDLRAQENSLARVLGELKAEAGRSGPDSLATLKLVKRSVDETLLVGALRSGAGLQRRVEERVARAEGKNLAGAEETPCGEFHRAAYAPARAGAMFAPSVAGLYEEVATTLSGLGGTIPKLFAEQALRARSVRLQLLADQCTKDGAPI